MLAPWKKSHDKPRQPIKKQRHYFANKGLHSQSYGFSSSHVQMWELDHKEGWTPKNWFFWTLVLEKTLESPLDCKEIKPVHPKENQTWAFTGRTDVEAEAPVLCPPDVKSWIIGKDSDPGKDGRQEEKGATGWGGFGWHHWFNGHEFEWTPRGSDRQGGLACCSSRGRKESDMTEQLNWTEFCLGLSYTSWPTFVGCGSSNLVFRALMALFWSGTLTYCWWSSCLLLEFLFAFCRCCPWKQNTLP